MKLKGNDIGVASNDYVIRVVDSPEDVNAGAWNALLHAQRHPTPFMRHEFLLALQASGCATPSTGWTPRFFLLERQGQLDAAAVVYVKSHSQGEFVFDWSWARAYEQHGLSYYPKAVCAVPFTPVSGTRLLALTQHDRHVLAQRMVQWCEQHHLSGLHGLFASDEDMAALSQAGMLPRQTVQFHWRNTEPGYATFEDFLTPLARDKRKKIRQERRKVADAGVQFRVAQGKDIGSVDWDFFYVCYERTYLEHGHTPYLNRAFFELMAHTMPEDWVMFTASKQGEPMASSLITTNHCAVSVRDGQTLSGHQRVAYGRYWGAVARVDCLHFEACYYQPIEWCIANGYHRFEGGAQGEHKLARALLPATSTSAHWLAHPQFFSAVEQFLVNEREGMDHYLDQLNAHSPFKTPTPQPLGTQLLEHPSASPPSAGG